VSDSQHWYTREGAPAHFQDGGGPTTLREARKQNLCPSVSTVLSIIAKPQLERWKRDQSVMAALTLPRMPDEPEADLLRRIASDASRQAKKAAEVGSSIHAAVEASFSSRPIESRFRPHVQGVRRMLEDNLGGIMDWVSEKPFASHFGYGGMCDLHSPSTGIVVDFKSSDVGPDDDKKLAWEQHYQLAAYQLGLGLPEAVGVNIFVSRTHPGHVRYVEWPVFKMQEGREVFLAALELWKKLKNYSGAW
jgi:hypothetical protein